MRFLFLCLLVYLGYRVLRGFLTSTSRPSATRPERRKEMGPVDDIMVRDPVCQTYIPKRDGIKVVIDGNEHFFCSTECRDKFMDRNKNG